MFVFIGIVLLLFACAFFALPFEFYSGKKGIITCVALILCLVSGLACIIASANISEKMIAEKEEWQIESSDKLLNFQDTSYREGTFFIGIGSVNENTYYCYYTATEQGYILNKLNTDSNKVYINYCKPSEHPHIDCICKHKTRTINNNQYWLWSITGWLKNKKEGDIQQEDWYGRAYKVYIPKGSIIENYDIDME